MNEEELTYRLNEEMRRSFEERKKALAAMKSYMQHYPTWPVVVESSVVEPIVDPARLLDEKKS